MRNNITIKLASQYSLLFSDIVLRVLILIFSIYSTIAYHNSTSSIVVIIIHLITIIIFFYFIKRRRIGIESFIKTRSKSHPKFNAFSSIIKCQITGDKSVFLLLSSLSSMVLAASIIIPYVMNVMPCRCMGPSSNTLFFY